jgi:hypothetical protein
MPQQCPHGLRLLHYSRLQNRFPVLAARTTSAHGPLLQLLVNALLDPSYILSFLSQQELNTLRPYVRNLRTKVILL